MGKQKSFQQVLQTFVEKLQNLNKTAKFPCTFSSNLYTKSCNCYCDFALKLFFCVLSLVCPLPFCNTAKTGVFQYTVWTRRIQHVLFPHSLSGSSTLGTFVYLKTRKDAATFWLQRNPDRPIHDHWFTCLYLATFKKVITKNVENLWQSSGKKAMENSHLPTLQRQVHRNCEQQKTRSLQQTGK